MSRTRGEAFASPRVGSAFDYLVAALAVATFLGFAVYPANARKWSDKTGSFSVEGELMAATDKDVVLKRADGNMMRVLLETLSDADREYVRQWGMPQDPSSDPGNPANAASATPRNASPSPRAPVPSPEVKQKALRLIGEVYGTEFMIAKTPDEREKLAKKMLQRALETSDVAERYALLSVARALAIRACPAVAFRVIDEIANTYQTEWVSASADTRMPIPSAEAQQTAMALVREIYGDEYEKAKTSGQKEALARTLLEQALETTESSNRYALLRAARDMVVQPGGTLSETAFEAVVAMAARYEIDGLDMSTKVLGAYASSASTPAQGKAVVQKASSLIDAAVEKGNWALAHQLEEFALAGARIAGDPYGGPRKLDHDFESNPW
jgi:hypothetical protein